ncbi:hypothetical protein ABZ569_34090 [Streptomyces albus]|uniref:hypothetical protein n=1 Tax=Streptomyces albus TaxID=1888 RepID=UPI0033E4CD17
MYTVVLLDEPLIPGSNTHVAHVEEHEPDSPFRADRITEIIGGKPRPLFLDDDRIMWVPENPEDTYNYRVNPVATVIAHENGSLLYNQVVRGRAVITGNASDVQDYRHPRPVPLTPEQLHRCIRDVS